MNFVQWSSRDGATGFIDLDKVDGLKLSVEIGTANNAVTHTAKVAMTTAGTTRVMSMGNFEEAERFVKEHFGVTVSFGQLAHEASIAKAAGR